MNQINWRSNQVPDILKLVIISSPWARIDGSGVLPEAMRHLSAQPPALIVR